MQCLCHQRELEDVNDNDEDGMLFLATATSKKEKQLTTGGRKGGRGGGREETAVWGQDLTLSLTDVT